MTGAPRYAIYYAAERGSRFDRFGAELLGYDAWSGEDIAVPEDVTAAVADWQDVTREPRTYGFHATLKAPFALAARSTESDLLAAAAAFAAEPRVMPRIRPVVASISGFLAIVPDAPSQPLQALAANCVTAFDRFRAPLTASDRARRKPEQLSERQRHHLDRWGYPYVMEDFRFHMTLTGRLEVGCQAAVLEMLRARFAALGMDVLPVDRIALFRQDGPGARFCIIGDWPLQPVS